MVSLELICDGYVGMLTFGPLDVKTNWANYGHIYSKIQNFVLLFIRDFSESEIVDFRPSH